LIEVNKIYHGDSFELINDIPDNSVDLILEDMPYGTTACDWDQGKISDEQKDFLKWFNDIPFDTTFQNESYLLYWEMLSNFLQSLFKLPIDLAEYWKSRKRIIKDNGAIVLTGSQPFTSMLVMSNLRMFKYEWIWKKSRASNPMMSKLQPMRYHENAIVFYLNHPIYNPIRWKGNKSHATKDVISTVRIHGNRKSFSKANTSDEKYPMSIIEINSTNNVLNIHPTQKPSELFEYLIKTYTNENDLVVDGFAGSGTTGVAAIKTNRNFICIEKDFPMFQKAEKRIKREQSILKLNFAA